jgi:excisionase family DNA binding protein
MGEILNIKEASGILGISVTTLRRWLNSDNPDLIVPHWKVGTRGDYRFDQEDVVQWKNDHKITGEN